MEHIVEQVDSFYSIVKLKKFRQTPGVFFDVITKSKLPAISAIDRVVHLKGAVSPGPVDGVERPWYMHPHQEDNLMVLYGVRQVDLYSMEQKKMLSFTVEPNKISSGDKVLYEGACMLVWPRYVFHRIVSGEEGSASVNLAVHHEGLDFKTNFNIYDLDTSTGEYRVLREGHKDQF